MIMAEILLMVFAVLLIGVWIKALVEYDGSKPDFCEKCDPERYPFPCEKNMRK